VPSASQSRSRRQHVVGLPYRRGNSLHGAPVHKIQRIPSKHWRSSARGRPPRGDGRFPGRCARTAAHCASVNPRHMPHLHHHTPCAALSDALTWIATQQRF
jgi:hypothetical protein